MGLVGVFLSVTVIVVFDGKELTDSAVLVDVLGRDKKLSVAFTVVTVGRTLVDGLGIFAVWSLVKFGALKSGKIWLDSDSVACTVLRDSDSFLDGLMSIEVRVFSVGLVGVLLSVTAIVVGISASTTVTSVSFRLPLLLSSDSFIISLVISESSRTSIFILQVTVLASSNFSTSEAINPFESLSAFLTLSCTSSAKF